MPKLGPVDAYKGAYFSLDVSEHHRVKSSCEILMFVTSAKAITTNLQQSSLTLPRGHKLPVGNILRNKLGQRIDCPLDVDPYEVAQLKPRKLCNTYHLKGGCPYIHCKYEHGQHLASPQLQALKHIARQTLCVRGSKCDEPDCAMGHVCRGNCTQQLCHLTDPDHDVEMNAVNASSGFDHNVNMNAANMNSDERHHIGMNAVNMKLNEGCHLDMNVVNLDSDERHQVGLNVHMPLTTQHMIQSNLSDPKAQQTGSIAGGRYATLARMFGLPGTSG